MGWTSRKGGGGGKKTNKNKPRTMGLGGPPGKDRWKNCHSHGCLGLSWPQYPNPPNLGVEPSTFHYGVTPAVSRGGNFGIRHQVTFSEAALERVEEAVLSGEIVNIDEKQLAPSKPVWVPKISIWFSHFFFLAVLGFVCFSGALFFWGDIT